MHLRNQLTALFSPTRRLIGPDRDVIRAGGPLGAMQWVVPRAQCHYRRIDLPNLSARKRQAAARIAARRYQPAAGALSHIAWTGSVAHLWTWTAPPEDLAASEDLAWLPETLLRAPPADDGARLLRMVEGFEGQLWRDGQLQASQWWPQPPGEDGWRRFLRGCGLPAGDARSPEPEPGQFEPLPWAETPWGDTQRGLPASPAALERLAWAGAFGLLAIVLGWQLAGTLTWSVARTQLDTRTETLRARAAPLLDARERADAARQALLSYHALAQQGISDYALMAQIVSPLPDDIRFGGWRREGARLQTLVSSADTDPRHFVSAFGQHPRLADVVASPVEGGSMQLDFTLPQAAAPGTAE